MPTPTVATLQARFCARHGCSPAAFERRLFWRCLHRPAVAFVWLCGGPNAHFFASDRRLIAATGRATRFNEVHEAAGDFLVDPDNGRWLRRVLKLRVSTSRLRAIARECLAGEGDAPLGGRPVPA